MWSESCQLILKFGDSSLVFFIPAYRQAGFNFDLLTYFEARMGIAPIFPVLQTGR